MNRSKTTIAVAACSLVIGLSGTASAGFKCWTNNEGNTECGDAIPPEYAQGESVEKNAQGLTVDKTERAKTAEEIAAEEAEKERLAKEKAEQERLAREKERRDRNLLANYTTEQDLILTRDGRIDAIESRIKHTQRVVKKLEKNLEELQEEAGKLEVSGKKVPDDLKAKIASVEEQIDQNLGSIELRYKEKEKLTNKFANDLARYRELKGTSTN